MLLTPHEIPVYRQFYGTEDRFHLLPPNVPRRTLTERERGATRHRLRAENGLSDKSRLLIFVGSDFKRKGLDRAIRSLGALPEELRSATHLFVIGQSRPARFVEIARQTGIASRVRFLGGRHDVPDWMLGADALIHPACHEAAGMVLVEALTAGLPVLCTDTCGYAFHIIKAGAGIVLRSPFSQEECTRALAEILASDKAGVWRANGLAYAAREDLYSCHERAADIIEQTIRRKLSGNQPSSAGDIN
jgi:UDP-glucose:(heptosyl)LPS alpha-1,3-glucosyltransferase